MSNSITKNGSTITIENCEKAIDDIVRSLNDLNIALKDRNLKAEKKVELKGALESGVHNLVDLVAASLSAGYIKEDKYKVLRATVTPKAFKGFSGHVNAIIKKYMEEQKKVPLHKDASISLIELARLVETPYRKTVEEAEAVVAEEPVEKPKGLLANTMSQIDKNIQKDIESKQQDQDIDLDIGEVSVSIPGIEETPDKSKETPEALAKEGYDDNQLKVVESAPEVDNDTVVLVESPDGEEAIIDKKEGSVYLKGTWKGRAVIWKKKLVGTSFTWYETVKNLLAATFTLVWDIVMTIASNIVFSIASIGKVGLGLVTSTASGLYGNAAKFFVGIKTSHARAKKTARARGLIYGEIKNPN